MKKNELTEQKVKALFAAENPFMALKNANIGPKQLARAWNPKQMARAWSPEELPQDRREE